MDRSSSIIPSKQSIYNNEFLVDESIPLKSELVVKADALVEAKDRGDVREQKELIKKIKELLSLRIHNEMRVLKLIDEGLVHDDGVVSDKALAMHKSAKDSLSDLIKVKMTLEGIATERKDVVHSFDVRALVDALRGAREGRVPRIT